MTAQQAFQCLVQKEFQVESPAVGERDDEAGEPSCGAPDSDLAERSPIGLGLLAWQDREAEKGFARDRAQFRDQTPQLAGAARVAAVAQHLKEPGGSQMRVLIECQPDEVEPGVERCSPAGAQIERGIEQGALDGLRMEAHFSGDCADLPMLGVVQAANSGDLFF